MTWRFTTIDRRFGSLRRFPWTVRIALVGAVVLPIALILATEPDRRRARLLERANWHESQIQGIHGAYPNSKYISIDRNHQPITDRQLARDQWHWKMMLKYVDAARTPMKPVAPDPPMP
ncbi:hypothetical protein P12x_002458 [Tundrisphaera lichenicola]|uniref:hypothetical protein n=1 Tax=Tundrisphaera lichenicola TaxID=2029860 RepID=UPI003EBCC333